MSTVCRSCVFLFALLTSAVALRPCQAAPGDPLFRENFNGNLNSWTASGSGDASIGNETRASGRSLRLRWRQVSLTSDPINAAVPGASLSVWIRRGSDSFSEDPEEDEDLVIEYLDSSNNWVVLDTFNGEDTPGEIFQPSYTLSGNALHANLRIRLSLTDGSGVDFDYWHVDDLEIIEAAATSPLIVGSCDDFESGLGNWTITTNGGSAGIGSQTANSGSNSLFTRWGEVTVTSNPIDLSAQSGVLLEVWVRRGADAFSEDPDSNNEGGRIEYLNSSNNWIELEYFPEGPPYGEIFNRSYTLNADALHSGFRIRFSQDAGSGADFDYWHYDDVCLSAIAPPAGAAQWYLDEDAWNNPGDVIDSSGSNYHGTASNASPVPGLLCNAVDLTASSSRDFISLDNRAMDGLTDFTVSFWGRSARSNVTQSPFSAANSSRVNEATLFISNTSTRVYLRDQVVNDFSTSAVFDNQWHHFAWTRAGNEHCIYVDGVQHGCRRRRSSAAIQVDPGGLTLGQDPDGSPGNFSSVDDWEGLLDEVLIFDRTLSQSEIQTIRTNHLAGLNWDGAARSCSAGIDHFVIDVGAPSASTCAAKAITISARDSANNVLNDYGGTVNISTSNGAIGRGDWSTLDENGAPSSDPAQGVLTPGAADSGIADYVYVPGTAAGQDSGSIEIFLTSTHAESLTISVVDASDAATATTSTAINFSDNAFDVVVTDAFGNEVIAGRPHALRIDMLRRDPVSGSCGVASNYNVADIKAWIQRDGVDPGGGAPSLTTRSETELMPTAEPGGANLTLPFVNGSAALTLDTLDVGKYTIEFKDDLSGFAALDIVGGSAMLTVRPFGLAFTSIQSGGTANPRAAAPGGGLFTAAGNDFSARLGAYLYDANDDLDTNGIPDNGADISSNGLTPAFAWDANVFAVLNSPAAAAGGVLGALNGADAVAGDFSGGQTAAMRMQYLEVGSIRLRAAALNYLGTSGINVRGDTLYDGSNGVIGRFGAHHFDITIDTAPELGASCGNFTYIDQSFDYSNSPQLTAIALANGGAGPLQNYHDFTSAGDGNFWLLDLGNDITQSYADAAVPAGVALMETASWSPQSGSGNHGSISFTLSGPFMYEDRNAPPYGPVAPFDASIDFDFAVEDADGAQGSRAIAPVNFVDPEQRWGRALIDNAFGPEVNPLPLPLRTEYFSGFTFVPNTDDACTTLALTSDVSLRNPGTAGGAAQAGNATMTINAGTSQLTSGNPTFSGGTSALLFSAPGAGNTGFIDVQINLGAAMQLWLRDDWDGDGVPDDDPTGRASFGLFNGRAPFIYLREPWN